MQPKPDNVSISIVVPVYRSAGMLPELHRRLTEALTQLNEDYEILLVEDCGGDNSWEVIEAISQRDAHVRGIKLSRNFGQHAATICGISKAQGKYIITLDDDLEHPPEAISQLIAKAREGYALVYGVFRNRTHSTWRNLTSELARRAFNRAIPTLNYEYTSFRIIESGIAKALAEFDSPFPFVDGYLSWLTNNYAKVEVPHCQRAEGTSNYNFRKLLIHTINIFVTFSDLPLRMASYIGFIFFLIGMAWLGVILFGKLFGIITVSGFASIMAAIVLFGGIQLLILGVFGEYIGRMNFKSSKKPLFLISREVGGGKE
jgi:undecaprenyl-phosphate 4-deoxy-4-formamido-L-arabinose transferase